MDVDVVVVGLGPGGEYAARSSPRRGSTSSASSDRLVGGECPFYGCIPSKMMIRAADVLAEARRVAGLGRRGRGAARLVAGRRADPRRGHRRLGRHGRTSSGSRRPGCASSAAHGRLDGPGRVVVGDDDVRRAARGVVLNTGTEPARAADRRPGGDAVLDQPRGREGAEVLPASLVVIGGGRDRAASWPRCSPGSASEVTVLEVADRIARRRGAGGERRCSTSVFARRGHPGARPASRSSRVDARRRPVHARTSATRSSSADQLLVAAGRRPNLADIGLETVGLDPDARSVEIDERMRAGERLWAIGDITGKGAFTHVSMYQAAVAVARHPRPRTARRPTTARSAG